jgi:hypothetical protein
VNYTLRDIIKHWNGDLSRINLLVDGASPVTGFEKAAEEVVEFARQQGVIIRTTQNAFEALG